MKPDFNRRPGVIVGVAAVLYAVLLVIAWRQGTDHAEKRSRDILESAETGFSAVIDGELQAALRNAGTSIIKAVGGTCSAVPTERLQELAETFNVDEINIADRRGITLASNLSGLIGFDYASNPLTAAYLVLTNLTATTVTEPFRHGVSNPDVYCKYYGMAFPDHSGFVQFGFLINRLRQNMYSYSAEEAERLLRDWHFSMEGWYERAMDDPEFAPGRYVRRCDGMTGGVSVGRFFDYAGYRYVAYLPERFIYSQRNSMFAVTAAVLAVLLVFFVFFLVKLARASAKLEALHAEAEARTVGDLALARKIQISALPSVAGAFTDWLEFTLAAESRPARVVGGDFFDFCRLPDGRVAFIVADVSGKGIPAAMFMMEVKNVLRECLAESADLAEAVAKANGRLCSENDAEMFVTVWAGALDAETGSLEYVNAGHNRPFVRHADGTVERISGKGGLFLGMFPEAEYRARGWSLRKGDRLFLYTDGITEAMNAKNEQFGETRLVAALAADDVRGALEGFVGTAEQSDDQTVLTVDWQGPAAASERRFDCAEAALDAVMDFLRASLNDVSPKVAARLLNAADEVVSNIVNYSGSPDFTVTVERTTDRVRLTFSDAGVEYNPLLHVDPDTHAAIEDRAVGGPGLVMVKRLVDRIAYAREDGHNILRIVKRTNP